MFKFYYDIKLKTGIVTIRGTIEYFFIDNELDIDTIRLKLNGSDKLGTVYVDDKYFPKFVTAYKKKLIENAKKTIETAKREANNGN